MSVSRKTLRDFLLTYGVSEVTGLHPSDIARNAALVNILQERLLTCKEAGDKGWYGCYAEMVYTVDRDDPYITLARGCARIISINTCDSPIPLRNPFYEYLAFGSGNWPKVACTTTGTCGYGLTAAFKRETVVATYAQLATSGCGLQFYANEDDAGKRVFVVCLDGNGQPIYTNDGYNLGVRGVFLTLAAGFNNLTLPSGTSTIEVTQINGLQKDVTQHPVSVYQIDLTLGTQTLLHIMEPGEQNAAYTRYYLNNLPTGCCLAPGTTNSVQVKAMVKLDLVPVRVDTDYLLIQSIPALIEEAQAYRLSGSDNPNAKGQAMLHHRNAVGYLNGLTNHYEGRESMAISFKPFGSATLLSQRIGVMR